MTVAVAFYTAVIKHKGRKINCKGLNGLIWLLLYMPHLSTLQGIQKFVLHIIVIILRQLKNSLEENHYLEVLAVFLNINIRKI